MLSLSHRVWKSIHDHAEEAYPYECCGVLLGSPTGNSWQIAAALRATNVEPLSPKSRYQIDPRGLVRITREAHSQGLEIAGFYHSHPDHLAQWSQTDLHEAHWLGCLYLITAVYRGKAQQTNAFELLGENESDKRFRFLPVTFEPAGTPKP